MTNEELGSITSEKAKEESEKYTGFTDAMRTIAKSAYNGKNVTFIDRVTESDVLKIKALGYEVSEQNFMKSVGTEFINSASRDCHVLKTFRVKW